MPNSTWKVLLNNEGTENGSLLQLLNRCITPSGEHWAPFLRRACHDYVGKRLFRIWLCMPLRNIPAINARLLSTPLLPLNGCNNYFVRRLDAVQDIINHPTFESEFSEIAKGVPDLERVVSRIHAKTCKVKDFLRVLTVCLKEYSAP